MNMYRTQTRAHLLRPLLPALLAALLFTLLSGCAARQDGADISTPSGTVSEAEATQESDANESSADGALVAVTSPSADEPGAESLETEVEVEPDTAEVDEQDLSADEREVLEAQGPSLYLEGYESREFLRYFKFYTSRNADGSPGRGRRAFTRWLERAELYLPYIRQVFRERGMPEDLIYLPFAESGFNVRAYSHAGAAGMWQFMPFTGRKFGLTVDWWMDERRNPYLATHAAADYLQLLHGMFDDWYLALAAYNAGEGRVGRALKRTGSTTFFELSAKNALPKETRHYVPKLLAILKIVRNLEKLGFDPIDWNRGVQYQPVTVQPGTDLLALSRECGMNWDDFGDANPSFRRYVSPPDTTCTIYLPAERVASAKAHLTDPASRPYAGYTRHRVRSGESWWRLSRRYGVPVTVLKKVNRTYSNVLHPGQWVMIPSAGAKAAVADAGSSASKTREYAQKRSNYVVKSGDNLWNISKRFGVSLSTLQKANGLSSGRYLSVGQKLYIPDGGSTATVAARKAATDSNKRMTYRVRSGDTVWSIARRFGIDPNNVLAWNDLNRRSVIHPGQTLKLYVD